MAEFERREAEKRDAERSKNDLEAYIISTGGILEDGTYDEVRHVTSPSSATMTWVSIPAHFQQLTLHDQR